MDGEAFHGQLDPESSLVKWKAVGPRVSEYYGLGLSQSDLEFIDVDLIGDDPLFVDPFLLRTGSDEWSRECVLLVQDFFANVLAALQANDKPAAAWLLDGLHEPNETHLGFSQQRANGKAIGGGLAVDVADALARSPAVQTGLLEDLEDTVLLVPGIGPDLISDLTTNIIRGPLADFTASTAAKYGIETRRTSARVWNRVDHCWETTPVELPQPEYDKGRRRTLLLVPRSIVRAELSFKADEYFRKYMLPYLEQVELAQPNQELVRMLKSGHLWVAKKDLIAKYGKGKDVVVGLTLRFPQVLEEYRRRKRAVPVSPASPGKLNEALGLPGPDFDALLAQVLAMPPGRTAADAYHKAIEQLLTAVFHPDLILPHIEMPMIGGLKRVDISYTNYGDSGFFSWLSDKAHLQVPNVHVECKNYSGDPKNPEIDQLLGRLGPLKGQFGLLVCRKIEDRDSFRARRKDALVTQKYVVGIVDEDLTALVEARRSGDPNGVFAVMKRLYDDLVM